MPTEAEYNDLLKRVVRLERQTYAPVRSGTIIGLEGWSYPPSGSPIGEDADGNPIFASNDTRVVEGPEDIRQGIARIRLDYPSGESRFTVLENVPIIGMSTILAEFSRLGIDPFNTQTYYEPLVYYPRVGDRVLVLWDGGKVYLALGQVQRKPED